MPVSPNCTDNRKRLWGGGFFRFVVRLWDGTNNLYAGLSRKARPIPEICPQIFGTRSFKIPSLFSTTPRATFQCVHHSRLGSFICTRNTFCCRPSYILPYKATQLCFFECSGRRLYRCFVFLPLANLKAADSANHPHRWNSSAANQFRFVPAKLFIVSCVFVRLLATPILNHLNSTSFRVAWNKWWGVRPKSK